MSLNEIVEDQRKYITITEQGVENVKSTDFPGTYHGYDDSWDAKKFIKNTRLEIYHLSLMEMRFDLVGVDVCVANALRRTIIAEVPSMAIDRIDVANNTSNIHDEHLCHMIALLPIRADPRLFRYRPQEDYPSAEDYPISAEYCIKFQLIVKCTRIKKAPNDAPLHACVYSRDLKWVPIDGQAYVDSNDVPKPVHDDILVAKLAPGQEINLTCYCYKDVGKTHAKFMPTCLFNFMELPEIRLRRRVVGEEAGRLKGLMSEGVVEVVKNEDGEDEAVVVNSRADLISRNVFHDEALKDAVSMKMVRDHFMFEVESHGSQEMRNLIMDTIQVIKDRLSEELAVNHHDKSDDAAMTSTAEKHKFKPKKKNKS